MEASIAANVALTQLAMTQKMVKMQADMQKQIVALLQEAVDSVPVSSSRGTAVNFSA